MWEQGGGIMHAEQYVLLAIMVVCGAAVVGSYIYGFAMHPGNRNDAWGEVPLSLRPFYFASMILAAIGFFAFTYWLLFRIDPDEVMVFNRFGYWMFYIIFAVILIPSAYLQFLKEK